MFEKQTNPNKQGDIGMGLAIAYFTTSNYVVSIPITDSQEYDLIVDKGSTLYKVFIRTSTRKTLSKGFEVGLRTQGGNFTRKDKSKPFDNTKTDLVFIALSDGRNYLIPSFKIKSKSSITVGGNLYNEYQIV